MEPEAKYTLVGGSCWCCWRMLAAPSAGWPRQAAATRCSATRCTSPASRSKGWVRSDVRMKGIRVGSVTGFAFSEQQPGAVVVTIDIDAATPVQQEHAGGRRPQPDHRPGDDPAGEPAGGQSAAARPAPGQRDPVIAEGESQLQQFSETASELAQRADETMRRINATLSNENQAALAETLVNLRDVSSKARARRRGPTRRCCRSRAPPMRSASHAGLGRDVHRLADRYDALGAEAGTTLRDARRRCGRSAATSTQLSRPRREPARRRQSPSCGHQPAAARHRRCGRRRGAQVPRSARDPLRSGRSEPGPGGEPMNRRGAGLALAALLAGCGGLGAPPPQRYFVLETAPSRLAPGALQRDAMLLVAPTTASSFYDTQEIIYSRRAGERAYYQLSSWTEPPNRGLASAARRPPRRQRRLPRRVREHEQRARRPVAAHPPGRALSRCGRLARHGPGDAERGAERSGRTQPARPAQLQRLGAGRQLRRRRRGAGIRPGARPAARRGRRLGRRRRRRAPDSGRSRRSSESFRSRCRSGHHGASCRRPRPSGRTARSDHALHHPDLRRREELRHDVRGSEGEGGDVRRLHALRRRHAGRRRAARRRRARSPRTARPRSGSGTARR